MHISYNTDLGNLNTNVGYGVAGYNIVTSLNNLGHRVTFADDSAPVEIFFCQPEYWWFSGEDSGRNPNQYKIGYVPWESTGIPDMWWPGLNVVDEIWTTSDWCKWAFENAGMKNVKVFEHGLDPIWRPLRRGVVDKFKFLHIGEPAPRKGGDLVLEAFMELFEGNDNVQLTMKAHNVIWAKYRKNGRIIPLADIPNIKVIAEDADEQQLVAYYMGHHCLVYPSYGEGFGFIPLQALGTGMPTICTEVWAPYRRFLEPLGISSKQIDSPWEVMHPGKVYEPDKDDLKQKMLLAYENYEELQNKFYNQAKEVHSYYNWDRLTEEAFAPIVKKFS